MPFAVFNVAGVTTLAGGKSDTDGAYSDGTGSNSSFNNPYGIAVDLSGNIFVGDTLNNRLRKVTPAGGMMVRSVGVLNFDSPCNLCGGHVDTSCHAKRKVAWASRWFFKW